LRFAPPLVNQFTISYLSCIENYSLFKIMLDSGPYRISNYMGIIMCMILTVTSAHAQKVSTVAEIYDLEVGDILHMVHNFKAYKYEQEDVYNKQVIDKYYELNMYNSKLVYVWDISLRRMVNEEPYEFEYWIDTTYFDDLNSLINDGNIDQVYSDPSKYNGRTINEYGYFIGPYTYQEWHWVDGCGLAYEYYNEDGGGGLRWTWNLVFFKKGEETWGTPNVIGIEENINSLRHVLAYPNPFTTSTTIEFALDGKSKIQISIFNTIGEEVFNKEDHLGQGTHQFSWSPHHLPAGLYYAVLRSEEGVSVVKMVKE